MEYSKHTENVQFDSNSIQKVLVTQLKKLRQQSPESFSKEIYVLPAVNDDVERQLEQQLQEEREIHSGKRILLIPCCLENSHWVGLLIEFQAADQVLRAEYIDPISESDDALDILQNQLAKVYPSALLQPKNLHKHNDRRFSSTLTIKNLLTAVENNQRPNFPNQQPSPSQSLISTASDTNRYSTESQSSSWSNNERSIRTPTALIYNKGNAYELNDIEQVLTNGLEKFRIRDVDMLSRKIKKTEERIIDYEEEERTDEVEKEIVVLKELQQLQKLSNEITRLKIESVIPKDNGQSKLQQMKEELSNGLVKLKIRDISLLPQKIQKTEERIREYEEDERTDDVEKETIFLKELQRLQALENEIVRLNNEPIMPKDDDQSQLQQMEEELNNGLVKLKIRDISLLPQKIQKAEERIRQYEEDERTDDVEKENIFLKELQRLQELEGEIARLKNKPVIPKDNGQSKLQQMKEELSNGLVKLKIRDISLLPQKIQKTEERIREYEEDERTDDVEKETIFLKELQRLQALENEIARLKNEPIMPKDDDQSQLQQMEEELNNGLVKLKIRDISLLPQKMQKAEERIRQYEEDERTDDVEKETIFLKELQRLQKLEGEIARLKNKPVIPKDNGQSQLQQMKEELSNGLAKLKIRDINLLPQKIQKAEERIKEYEEDERTDDVEKEKVFLKELQRLQRLAIETVESPSVTIDSSVDSNSKNIAEQIPTSIPSFIDMNELNMEKSHKETSFGDNRNTLPLDDRKKNSCISMNYAPKPRLCQLVLEKPLSNC